MTISPESISPDSLLLHQRLRAVADGVHDRPAIIGDDGAWSYGELDRNADRVAAAVSSAGLARGEIIGVVMGRGRSAIAAILGILRAGHPYVPLDPSYPEARIAQMIALSQCRVIVRPSDGAICSDASELIGIDVDRDAPAGFGANHSGDVSPDSPAYVIFTSGSTGVPKGVVIQHRHVCALVDSVAQVLFDRDPMTVLQFAPLSFDASVWEIFPTLLSGSTLAILPGNPNELGPRGVLDFTQRHSVDVATFPPPFLAGEDGHAWSHPRTVVFAGEPLPAPVAKRWSRGRRVVNAYGPTETTVCATLAIDPEPTDKGVSIGDPLPHVRIQVRDQAGVRILGPGTGELWIGGESVSTGYVGGDEALNAPFRTVVGADGQSSRFYRSGDLVERTHDGALFFRGRADDQVKIRGHRVELGEIEASLRESPEVQQAVAVVAFPHSEDARLVAWVVGPAVGDLAQLRTALAQRLPPFIVPNRCFAIDRLPLHPNGKVDRSALAAMAENELAGARPGTDRVSSEQHDVGPVLAAVWMDVLNVGRADDDDDFFAVGGHSMLAVQLSKRAEAALGRPVSLKIVMTNPRFGDLVAALS